MSDAELVESLLGRKPQGEYRIVVRDTDGTPVVIENAPLLDDGTPMPTTYWLLPGDIHYRVSQLESSGGVNQAEEEIGLEKISQSHDAYARRRNEKIGQDHLGIKPSGGVGGTRVGVKCLHAHIAWWLAGGDDPVGDWVAEKLSLSRPINGVIK